MTKKFQLLLSLTLLIGILACKIVALDRSQLKEPPPPLRLAGLGMPGSGAPIRIAVETIGLDAPVVEMDWQLREEWGEWVAAWNVPDNEAAWHRNSARPGQGSNVVISGHNNSMGGRVFARLEDLSLGDKITLWNDSGTSFVYEVRDIKFIRTLMASAESLVELQTLTEPTSTEQLTLVTCWPNWTNTHRLIISAIPPK